MKKIAFIVFMLIPLFGISQTNLFNWNEVGIKLKPSKRFSVSLGGQYRWDVTNKVYGKTLFSGRLKYDIAKPFSIQASYRRTWMPNDYFYLDNEMNTYGHRFAGGIVWDLIKTIKPKAKTSLKYTAQFQKEFFKFKREQIYWRNKLALNLNIGLKRIQPFLSAESFYRTNQQYQLINNEIVVTGLMNEMRYEFGFNFNLPKNHSLEIGAIYRDFKTNKWDAYVVQCSYFYTIEKKKVKTVGTPEF
jgi:hypothetical protein